MESHRRKANSNGLTPAPADAGSGRALVIGPYLRRPASGPAREPELDARSPAARLEEAIGLARAIELLIVGQGIVHLAAIRPATYLGKGKVEEIAGIVKSLVADLVVLDCAISPVQQRNLERAWNAKVVDRTGLILEIFGRRARTREGALQVEHAHLTYQKSRLVRSWTHLERQRGGFGFLGGPGETQLEADRRVIEERLARIEQDLERVKQTRRLHRTSRKRVPYPIVALVGYTNAGKSTLFNRLTSAQVVEADMLFATLDPTLRAIVLPHGAKAIISDTVGFISDLPTMLIAAFRATLEEVIEADMILHVRDVSHGDTEAQAHDVEQVLQTLGLEADAQGRVLEVWNKIDQLTDNARLQTTNLAVRDGRKPILISALTGEGLDQLSEAIERRLGDRRVVLELAVDAADGAGISWLHRNAEVMAKSLRDDGHLIMRVRVDPTRLGAIQRRFDQKWGDEQSHIVNHSAL